MLLLNRRVGERIVIGENVVVAVLSVSGQQVRLGIDAPREIAVHREEVATRIERETALARSHHPGPRS